MVSTRTVILALVAGLAIGITLPTAQADSFDEVQNSTDHGYENGTMGVAFSLDKDQHDGDGFSNGVSLNNSREVPFSHGEGSKNTTGPPENKTTLSWVSVGNSTDITYTAPPDTYQDWNRHEISNFSVGGDDTSRYPAKADTVDGKWIRDAHSTKFWVSPSTRAHLSDDQTVLYTAKEGTVYGIVDYRVVSPPDDTDGSDGVKKERSLVSHSIENVCLIQGLTTDQIESKSDPCDDSLFVVAEETENLTHPSIEYQDDATGNRTYHLVAEISSEIEVVTHVEEDYEDCTRSVKPDGSITTNCVTKTHFVKDDTSTISDKTITTDRWEARIYDTQGFTVATTQRDNGTLVHAVSRNYPWAGINVSGTRFSTDWRFYTHRSPGWDEVTTASNGGSSTTSEFETVPVKTYAYPSTQGTTRISHSDTEKVFLSGRFRGENRTSPVSRVNESVAVSIAMNNSAATTPSYQPLRAVQIHSYSQNIENVQMRGLVRGESLNISRTANSFEAENKETEMTASVLDSNETHVVVNITLQTTDGDPVDLRKREGEIVLPNGDSVVTDQDGSISVVFEGPHNGRVNFEPGVWYGRDVAYESSYARYSAPGPLTSVNGFIAVFLSLMSVFGPVLGTLYLLDGTVGIDTWPPHRK